jgi:hypothetical protein
MNPASVADFKAEQVAAARASQAWRPSELPTLCAAQFRRDSDPHRVFCGLRLCGCSGGGAPSQFRLSSRPFLPRSRSARSWIGRAGCFPLLPLPDGQSDGFGCEVRRSPPRGFACSTGDGGRTIFLAPPAGPDGAALLLVQQRDQMVQISRIALSPPIQHQCDRDHSRAGNEVR